MDGWMASDSFIHSEYGKTAFLTDRRNYGAHEVKATRKIPAAPLVDDAGGGSVPIGVQKLVQPLQRQRTVSQMVLSKRVINLPELYGLCRTKHTYI